MARCVQDDVQRGWNVLKREAPIGTTWMLRIKDDWTATQSPCAPISTTSRPYAIVLATVTELFRLQTENRMLRWECERLAKKVGEWLKTA
jgi:hypothetical protein